MRQINIINREVARLGFQRFLEIVNSMREPEIAFDNKKNPSFVYAKNKNGSVLYFYRITFAGEFIKSRLINDLIHANFVSLDKLKGTEWETMDY